MVVKYVTGIGKGYKNEKGEIIGIQGTCTGYYRKHSLNK
jgi:hypothetical protein